MTDPESDTEAGPQPWRVESSRVTYRDRWISLRSDRCVRADGRVIEPFHVLEYPDWVNIVATTSDGQLVLIREYRHGAGAVLTALPSGVIDPAEPPVQAARRELREETGYTGGRLVALGRSFANPANLTNSVHSFLALGVERTEEPSLDDSEEIQVLLADYLEAMAGLFRGELSVQVSHIAALHQSVHALLANPAPETAPLRERLRALLHGL